MKTLIMALVALSVVTGIAPVANAFELEKLLRATGPVVRRQPLNLNRPKARGRDSAVLTRPEHAAAETSRGCS